MKPRDQPKASAQTGMTRPREARVDMVTLSATKLTATSSQAWKLAGDGWWDGEAMTVQGLSMPKRPLP
jgi:hypothetical protein